MNVDNATNPDLSLLLQQNDKALVKHSTKNTTSVLGIFSAAIFKVIFDNYSNPKERAKLKGVCKGIKTIVEGTSCDIASEQLGRLCKSPKISFLNYDGSREVQVSIFLYDSTSKVLYTGDNEYYKLNLKSWSIGALATSIPICFQHDFFKSIKFLSVDERRNLFIASSSFSSINIYNLENNSLVRIGHFNEKCFDKLHYDKQTGLLLVGFDRGKLAWIDSNFIDIINIFSESHDGIVIWIDYDPELDLIFSGSLDGVIKIWNKKDARCLFTIDSISHAGNSYYDRAGKRIIAGYNGNGIGIWDAKTGKQLQTYVDGDETAKFSTLHYNEKKKKVFAAFTFLTESRGFAKCKIVTWTIGGESTSFETRNNLKGTFNIQFLDYDEDSDTILSTGSSGLQLWNAKNGALLSSSLEDNRQVMNFQWIKSEKKLFVLSRCLNTTNSSLAIIEYGKEELPKNAPKEIVESKQEQVARAPREKEESKREQSTPASEKEKQKPGKCIIS
ncbi:MAG: hypothetical protein H0W88_05965 [Parachlamydiaceae bacterium]|nr:hypothetical protein [Parachlamydiaceae bacterium]